MYSRTKGEDERLHKENRDPLVAMTKGGERVRHHIDKYIRKVRRERAGRGKSQVKSPMWIIKFMNCTSAPVVPSLVPLGRAAGLTRHY